jgi:TnpA family transposase
MESKHAARPARRRRGRVTLNISESRKALTERIEYGSGDGRD